MITLESVLDPSVAKKIPANVTAAINEAIGSAIASETARIEADMSDRFTCLVEGVGKSIEDRIDDVIVESVGTHINGDFNNTMGKILTDMINLLENSGIMITEKAKNLQKELQVVNKKLEEVVNEREQILDKFLDSDKENYIYSRMQGINPKLVQNSILYFKDKSLDEVKAELEHGNFLDRDLKTIVPSLSDDSSLLSDGFADITIEQVGDVLKDIQLDRTATPGFTPDGKNASVFESLGRGTKRTTVPHGTCDVTPANLKSITESALAPEESVNDDLDVQHVIDQNNRLQGMGYGGFHRRK